MKLIFTTLFCFYVVCSFSQFTVIGVEGNIESNAQQIEIGTTLQGESLLSFREDNAKLFLVDDSLHFFETETFDLEAELGECLVPFNSKHRGFKRKAQAVRNLGLYFGPKLFTIIGDTLRIPLDIEMYPLNNKKFIVFHYKINGEQQSKKVAFDEQHLIVIKDDLFTGKTKQHTSEILKSVKIYTFEPDTKISKKVTQINLRFVPQQRFVKECRALANKGNTLQLKAERIAKKVDQYIYGRYMTLDPKQQASALGMVF